MIVWLSLSIALTFPLVVSTWRLISSVGRFCLEGASYYGYAPLMAPCGEPSTAEVFFGWLATSLTVASFLVAVVASALSVVTATTKRQRRMSGYNCSTAASVLLAITAVVWSNPDQLWGTNAWIFFASWTGCGVLIACAAVCAVIERSRRL